MKRRQRAARVALLTLMVSVAAFAANETRKEYRFTVGPQASVTINNQYGPISVKPGAGNVVVVKVLLRSDKVEVDRNQNGNRVVFFLTFLPARLQRQEGSTTKFWCRPTPMSLYTPQPGRWTQKSCKAM